MENLSRQEIIKKTFDAMPREFTSNEFVRTMIELGGQRRKKYSYGYREFLKNNCIQEAKKSWVKNPPTMEEQLERKSNSESIVLQGDYKASKEVTADQVLELFDHPRQSTFSVSMSLEKRIEEAIALLKANGYRVQKIILQDV